jgi:hypothetical protein
VLADLRGCESGLGRAGTTHIALLLVSRRANIAVKDSAAYLYKQE